MRRKDSSPSKGQRSPGRAMLVGYGRDAPDGHLRLTRSEDFCLAGGSESIHLAMQRRAVELLDELRRRGIRIESIGPEECARVQETVEELTRPPARPARSAGPRAGEAGSE